MMTAKPRLTGAALLGSFAPDACDWFIVSRIKTGKRVVWSCKACHTIAKKQDCPFATGRLALSSGEDSQQGSGS
jgi:cytochrome c2